MALPRDREWYRYFAVETNEKQSSLNGDVNGAARGSRVEKSVGRGHKYEKQHIYTEIGHGHKYEKQHIYTEIEKESVSNSGIQ